MFWASYNYSMLDLESVGRAHFFLGLEDSHAPS